MSSTHAAPAAPIKLYRNAKSGHCHRAELMMALLDLPYEPVGAHKAPEFLKKNPFGQVPAIDDGSTVLSDSNAIIIYLAEKYGDAGEWTGHTPEEKAAVQRWLSVAAGEIAAGPCSARLVTVFGAPLDHDAAKAKAHALFEVMNTTLDGQSYLACGRLTLADVAGYSYIAHAPEGGVSLKAYPNIGAWLSRIEAQSGFVPMAATPLPEMA